MQLDARIGTFRLIEERLLDEQNRVLLREARQELLRALPDESPAQVAEDDDTVTIGVTRLVDFNARAFRQRWLGSGTGLLAL